MTAGLSLSRAELAGRLVTPESVGHADPDVALLLEIVAADDSPTATGIPIPRTDALRTYQLRIAHAREMGWRWRGAEQLLEELREAPFDDVLLFGFQGAGHNAIVITTPDFSRPLGYLIVPERKGERPPVPL